MDNEKVTIEEALPILDKISIFGGMTGDHLNNVVSLLKKAHYKTGGCIFKQGEEPTNIYIILSGEIQITTESEKDCLTLATFKTGDCFGETSVIGIQAHSCTAIATTDTELFVMERNALLAVYQSDPELFGLLILNIARETCRRLHNANKILVEKKLINEIKDDAQRIISF